MDFEHALKVRRECRESERELEAQLVQVRAERRAAESLIAEHLSPLKVGQTVEGVEGRDKGVRYLVTRCRLWWVASEEPFKGSTEAYGKKLKKDGTPGLQETRLYDSEKFRVVS